jgi:hypothetical protein
VFRTDIEAGIRLHVDPDSRKPLKLRDTPQVGMVEGKALHCCNYWVASEHEDGDGALDMPRFLQDLGFSVAPATMQKRTTPPRPNYHPGDQKLRLTLT